jgi:phosphatidylserine decarboxylase
MPGIQFHNSLTGRMETEAVYGECWLRFVYETGPGRLLLRALVARGIFSRWYGWRMDAPSSRRLIAPFIERYGLDESEFAEATGSFKSFNEFFVRRLKPEARPVDADPGALVFPADGRHLLVAELGKESAFWVKGARLDLSALLGDAELAARFEGGSALVSRLCPVDYHRFHFPVDCLASAPVLIRGPLYSVNPVALRWRPSILWENKRWVTRLDAGPFGGMAFVEVGATCVGSVAHSHPPEQPALKGGEKGRFRFGGSCVILLVERGRVEWNAELLEQGGLGVEVYDRMGRRAALGTPVLESE